MDKRKILTAVTKINKCKLEGQQVEALLRLYHLNIQILVFMLQSVKPDLILKHKKTKEIITLFSNELEVNSELRAIMTKKNNKAVKLWLKEMDVFFKLLKTEMPKNLSPLQNHGHAVFNLLNISANKIFAK